MLLAFELLNKLGFLAIQISWLKQDIKIHFNDPTSSYLFPSISCSH